jgi:voltage-gated potassium channel
MIAHFIEHFLKITGHLRTLYLMLLSLIMIGAAVIAATEKVSFGKAVYFAFITGLTVGYGDIVPTTAPGRVVSVLMGLIGILFTGMVVATAVEATRHAWEEMQRQNKKKPGRSSPNDSA